MAVPRYQKWRKTSCFAAIFKLFALFFSNFDEFQKFFRFFSENFQNFFRKFSEIFQKIFRNLWKFSEKNLKYFWKIYESRNCLLPTIQKWRKLAVLLLFSKFSASFSLLLAVLLLFSNFLRCFSRILTNFRNFSENFQIFFRNFWKFSEKFLKYFWKIYESRDFLLPTIQKWRKLAVLLLFSKFSASFSLLLAVLLLFSNFLCCFSRILTNFRNFSEILVRNISEIFQKLIKFIQYLSRLGRKSQSYVLLVQSVDILALILIPMIPMSCATARLPGRLKLRAKVERVPPCFRKFMSHFNTRNDGKSIRVKSPKSFLGSFKRSRGRTRFWSVRDEAILHEATEIFNWAKSRSRMPFLGEKSSWIFPCMDLARPWLKSHGNCSSASQMANRLTRGCLICKGMDREHPSKSAVFAGAGVNASTWKWIVCKWVDETSLENRL